MTNYLRILTALAVAIPAAAQTQYRGAVPEQTAPSAVSLTLREAIRLALKNNLGTVLAGENSRAVRGQRIAAMSRLLPHLDSKIVEASQQVNLAAYGFSSFPGTKSIVGPFSLFDARASVSQTLVNFRNINSLRASDETLRASNLEAKDARDTVVLVITDLYLEAVSAQSRIAAARARVTAAQPVYDQTANFKQSGMVPGIDVLRADVQLRGQKQRLIAYQNEFEKQKLRLAWALGLPSATALTLADAMPSTDSTAVPKLEQALALTLESRMDYRGLQSRVKAAELTRKAVSAGRIPTVAFNADYGAIGKSPASLHGTYSAALGLNIPLFDGNRIKGGELEADASVNTLRAELAELRARIELELRSAYLDLQAASEQLEVARSTIELARRQEEQGRDRFAAGVATSLEVVQAQDSLAQADENLISSLLAINRSKAALARSIGSSENNIPLFLLGAN